MATVTKAANAQTVVTTGWSNPSNAFATSGNNVYATAAPGKNATVNGDFGFPVITSVDIPDGSSINSVTATVEWKVSTTTVATLGVQLRNNGVALGTETTFSSTTEAQSTQVVNSGVVLDDLRNGLVVARVRDTRGNSNTSHTGSLDFVSLTVDYTAGTTYNDTCSGTLTLGGSATSTHSFSDSRTGTITLTGSATDSFSGPTVYNDTATGTITLSGLKTESFSQSYMTLGSVTLNGSRSESFTQSYVMLGTVVLAGAMTESWSGYSAGISLNKEQSQGEPYGWVWFVRGTRSVACKYIGTTQFYLGGADDAELLAKINLNENYRQIALGKPSHG